MLSHVQWESAAGAIAAAQQGVVEHRHLTDSPLTHPAPPVLQSARRQRADGIVTPYDIHGDRAVRAQEERRIRRDQLRLRDVMTPLPGLDAIDFGLLPAATVGKGRGDLAEARAPVPGDHRNALAPRGRWPLRAEWRTSPGSPSTDSSSNVLSSRSGFRSLSSPTTPMLRMAAGRQDCATLSAADPMQPGRS